MNFSYLKFLLKSTNQHGVHSPFVYQFVTRCLYNKQLVTKKEYLAPSPILSKKEHILLLKIIRYFKITSIFTDEEKLSTLISPKEKCVISTAPPTTPPELIFINHPKENMEHYLSYMANDSILIVNRIYLPENKKKWETFVSHSKVTAYINVYWQGYVFIRKEQPKQAFYIR